MAHFQAKPREDGRGPYRWAHVVTTPKGLALGTIYRQLGDDLLNSEANTLRALCDRYGFDLRRAPIGATLSTITNPATLDKETTP